MPGLRYDSRMIYDLVVIGGGPAGYVGAISAAQLGKSVLCIERGEVGGTCLNRGCIPTKALLESAAVFTTVTQRAAEFGILVPQATADWSAVVARSRKVCERLSNGVGFLLKKNKVQFLNGEARLEGAGRVEVTLPDGSTQSVQASRILIATGACPREIPAFPFNGRTIISSKEALLLPELPESMLVIGSGAIGAELSCIYRSFGTQVTLVESLPRLLPREDEDISATVEREFRKQGITCYTGAAVESVQEVEGGISATVSTGAGRVQVQAAVCLVAAGVQPVVPAGPELTERGFIRVNKRYETSLPGVYAVGDCIGGAMLAHKASYEAVQAVQGMFTEHTPKPAVNVPSCYYMHPQVASVGKTEQELKACNIPYKVGKIPFRAIGRAVAAGEAEGFVKLLFGKTDGELLGAHLVGPHATELVTAPGLALAAELTDADIESMIYAHPTLSEAIHEAVLAADGLAIHA